MKCNFVRSGKQILLTGEEDYKPVYKCFQVISRHFTYVFNVFVMLQVFNFMNARKIEDEKNVFSGLERNWMFLAIVGGIIIG